MRFIRYSKFMGFDVFGVDLGALMDGLADAILDSGYNDDYWWTRERADTDDSIDALRKAILDSLLRHDVLSESDAEQMLADNGGKFHGSILEELINQLIERLLDEGYLKLLERPPNREGLRTSDSRGTVDQLRRNIRFEVTEKGLDFLGFKTLQKLLGSVGAASLGRHETARLDTGVEAALGSKSYEYGDTINLDVSATLMSAIARNGLQVPIDLEYGDLQVHQQDFCSSCATVVMLDCSHSMILYGEDRFTPAKKVAIALSHLIRTQYAGDSMKVVLFHDTAEEIPIAKLASTQVGPYHTNTAEGLKLSRRILTAQRKEMRQIVMITDGKPTAALIDPKKAATFGHSTRKSFKNETRLLYKNSMGNDPIIMAETFREVQACSRSGVMINTFMLASDPFLVEFVKQMTAMTKGKAYFANPNNLTQFVLFDFMKRRTSRVS
ncbi:MAG: VWA domain-containing protein [Pyrinomonadaceae bacterium]